MRVFTITFCIFLAIVGLASTAGFFILVEPGTGGRLNVITTQGKLFLFKHSIIKEITEQESQILYKSTCTRKCHSTDVIENKPRTAVEWEWVVARMNTPERANLSKQETSSITEYLQRHFLSNVPTILPERTMSFLKRHLWKSDFGEEDIYLDLIYIPSVHTALLPYLTAGRPADTARGASEELFILYLNTHSGTVPPWDLADIAIMRDTNGNELHALSWEVIYDDGQLHHRQGLLSFPSIDTDEVAGIEIEIDLPGMRKRFFLWDLPIPNFNPEPVEQNDA
jgi:hypothetical protein